jgi:hypothetical protein
MGHARSPTPICWRWPWRMAHGGCFVTFDGGVPLSAVPRAQKKHLRVI